MFVDLAPLFKTYGQYAKYYDAGSELLKKFSDENADGKFALWLAEQWEKDPRCKNVTLASLLITPIQRVPRYVMLIAELLKRTAAEHPDYGNLVQALEGVKVIGTHINEAIRKREQREQILSLEKKFTSPLNLSDKERHLVKEGPLTRTTRRSHKVFHFHLFNDLLLYSAITPTGQFLMHRRFPLHKCRVRDFSGDPNPNPDKALSFQITSPEKSFEVSAASAEEKQEWVNALKMCTRGQKGTSLSAPVWKMNSASKQCQQCQQGFSVIRRRHHCRACGGLVCDKCSATRKLLEYVNAKRPVRVCDGCAMIPVDMLEAEAMVGGNVEDLARRDSDAEEAMDLLRYYMSQAEQPPRPSQAPLPNHNPTLEVVRSAQSIASEDERYAVLLELLTDESKYTIEMDILLEVYIEPLLRRIKNGDGGKQDWKLDNIPIEGALAIFLNNIEPIVSLNGELHKQLLGLGDASKWIKAPDNAKGNGVGKLFVRFASLFSLYSQYARHHWRAANLLTSKKFAGVMDELDEDPRIKMMGLNASYFLALPLQRIPQYGWSLEKLLAITPEDHLDRAALAQACELMRSEAEALQMASTEGINLQALVKLAAKFTAKDHDLVMPGRALIREGPLSRVTRRGRRTFHFHLLTDLLLYR